MDKLVCLFINSGLVATTIRVCLRPQKFGTIVLNRMRTLCLILLLMEHRVGLGLPADHAERLKSTIFLLKLLKHTTALVQFLHDLVPCRLIFIFRSASRYNRSPASNGEERYVLTCS